MRKHQNNLSLQVRNRVQHKFRLHDHITMEGAMFFAMVPTLALIIAHFIQ